MDSTPPTDPDLLEKVINLAKRRGFIFPSAEIYGGFRSTYDYGPLGVNMLRNVKQAWWFAMVQMRDDIVGLDAAILGPPAIWAASGHLETFTDPLVDCKKCKERWREDKIDGVCPNCGSTEFTEPRAFNLMFKTQAGPVEGEGATAYLRPETAQGMFTNFANVLASHAQEAALRHRPDRQVLPQRDHPAELRLSHPRVRADGDGVLRPAGRRRHVVPLLD
jgi:glycyl-tRNA synthetase